MVNKPLIRPYFWEGGRLISHDSPSPKKDLRLAEIVPYPLQLQVRIVQGFSMKLLDSSKGLGEIYRT